MLGDDLGGVDAIGGLTMGADPVAFGMAAVLGARGRRIRCFSVRKEAKQGGITGRIAGALDPGDRVLVVEDEPTIAESVVSSCRECGYDVEWAPSGEAALGIISEPLRFDLRDHQREPGSMTLAHLDAHLGHLFAKLTIKLR